MLREAAITGEAQARADVYGFLATVFGAHPTQEIVHAVRRMAAEMGIPCPDRVAMDELDREYMELFVVPNPRYVAPYESVFRDHWLLPAVLRRGSNPGETGQTIKGLLMGQSTLDVRQRYLRAGILPGQELPDHIANELRFMAYTSGRQVAAPPGEAGAWAELREQFRRDHLVKWIALLRAKVVERERLGYYGAALQIAETLLQDEDAG